MERWTRALELVTPRVCPGVALQQLLADRRTRRAHRQDATSVGGVR